MELLKPKDRLTYSIGDVKFFIRSTMTARDKFRLGIMGEYKNGVFAVDRGEVFEKVIDLFVEGWEGVTEDGKPVPYSYDTFMNRIPGDTARDWVLKLGVFIIDSLGLAKDAGDAQTKNA